MKKLIYTVLFALAVAATVGLLVGSFDPVSKNHPPFEAKIQTDEQKQELKKLVNQAEANYKANKAQH